MRGPVARLVGLALAATGASGALASPAERYEDGVSAYQKNDFDRSIKTLRPLAEKGDARAQYMLGRHYQFGQGVKADKAEAYYWYKRAEARGHLEAKLFRQLLEKRWKLTADEKSRGERKLADLNAPKTKPEKPKVETARAAVPPRDEERPAVTSRPSEPPPVEPARAALPERPAAKLPAAPPSKSPAAMPPKGPTETARFTPPVERAEPNRTPPRRVASDDDDEGDTRTADVRTYRPSPAPAETRAALPPTHDGPASELDTPNYTPPGYTPPNYAPRNEAPTYTQPNYAPPTYAAPGYTPPNYSAYTQPPPYYAPGAAPSWRPPYYAPPPGYYGPRPGWGYAPRAQWQGAWRGVAWGPGPGFRRYRGGY